MVPSGSEATHPERPGTTHFWGRVAVFCSASRNAWLPSISCGSLSSCSFHRVTCPAKSSQRKAASPTALHYHSMILSWGWRGPGRQGGGGGIATPARWTLCAEYCDPQMNSCLSSFALSLPLPRLLTHGMQLSPPVLPMIPSRGGNLGRWGREWGGGGVL